LSAVLALVKLFLAESTWRVESVELAMEWFGNVATADWEDRAR
jgi:hypothetical protein